MDLVEPWSTAAESGTAALSQPGSDLCLKFRIEQTTPPVLSTVGGATHRSRS